MKESRLEQQPRAEKRKRKDRKEKRGGLGALWFG
jgi:hypothetical protein